MVEITWLAGRKIGKGGGTSPHNLSFIFLEKSSIMNALESILSTFFLEMFIENPPGIFLKVHHKQFILNFSYSIKFWNSILIVFYF